MIEFSGENKTITITDEATVDVMSDLYSAWKVWVTDNPQWDRAFRVVGGDYLGGGAKAPAYFFLTNSWMVVVDGCDINVSYNLFSDDYDTPFKKVNGGAVLNQTSSVPMVATGSGLSTEEHNKLMGIVDEIFNRVVEC